MAEAPTTPSGSVGETTPPSPSTPANPSAPAAPTDKVDAKNQKPAPKAPAKSGMKYFKSSVSGLAFMDEKGTEVIDRFQPYAETFQGETVRRGYLETNNPRTIKLASEDHTVEEVSKSDYDKMLKDATPLGYPGV